MARALDLVTDDDKPDKPEADRAVKPSKWTKRAGKVFSGKPLTVHVDGNCTGGVGHIGFAVFDPDGKDLVKVGDTDNGYSNN